MDYSKRQIHSVWIEDFATGADAQGLVGVFGRVKFELTGPQGDQNGPILSIVLSTRAGEAPTIREGQRALLAAALDLLNRGWKEDPAALEEMAFAARSVSLPDEDE